jgi:hypothetical protein
VLYSASRVVIVRTDKGSAAFNASGVFGTMMGIAVSNAYYPSASRHTSVMLGRLDTSFTGGIMGNLMSEFWPDLQGLQKKIFRRKKPAAATATAYTTTVSSPLFLRPESARP